MFYELTQRLWVLRPRHLIHARNLRTDRREALPPASPGAPGDRACPPPSRPSTGENKSARPEGTAALPQKRRSWAGVIQASPSHQQQLPDPQRTWLVGPKPSSSLPTLQTKQARPTATPEVEGQELQLPAHFHSSNSLHIQPADPSLLHHQGRVLRMAPEAVPSTYLHSSFACKVPDPEPMLLTQVPGAAREDNFTRLGKLFGLTNITQDLAADTEVLPPPVSKNHEDHGPCRDPWRERGRSTTDPGHLLSSAAPSTPALQKLIWSPAGRRALRRGRASSVLHGGRLPQLPETALQK